MSDEPQGVIPRQFVTEHVELIRLHECVRMWLYCKDTLVPHEWNESAVLDHMRELIQRIETTP